MCATQLDPCELMLRSLQGAALHRLKQPADGVWEFDFETAGLNLTCPRRIVGNGGIALAASDHGQKFELPAPVDVFSKTLEHLHGASVESIEIDSETSDLCIRFSNGSRIDAFNNSGGYEGWNYADRAGVMLVAMGGGRLAIWGNLPKNPRPAPARRSDHVQE